MSSTNANLDKIEHIVVLMMENRSFDNVLGRLYPDNPNFNGVNDSMSNPRPDGELAYVDRAERRQVYSPRLAEDQSRNHCSA